MPKLICVLAVALLSCGTFALADTELAAPSGGCIPKFQDGQPAGVDCSHAPAATADLHETLGMQEGDVIHSTGALQRVKITQNEDGTMHTSDDSPGNADQHQVETTNQSSPESGPQ